MNIFPGKLCARFRFGCVAAAILLLGGCGGGGSGGSTQPPPVADFTLAFTPPSMAIPAGSSMSTTLSATALNGFSSVISVQESGLPAGVSVSPANISLTPGTPITVTLSALSGSSAPMTNVVFTGSAGSLTHAATLAVTVTAGIGNKPLNTRTTYVRTDAVTEYGYSLNTHWVVYQSATSRFFVTDPFSNQIFVMDAVSQKKIATISVPGAWGMDDTSDHSTLYVGTLMGDVYTIDPVKMQVKHRYLASQIGPYGFNAISTLVMSDGRVALLGGQGGIPSVDGSQSVALWNPTDNSISIYGSVNSNGIPTQPLPLLNIGGFARTGDRVGLLLGSIDSDGTLSELMISTGQFTNNVIGGFGTTNLFPSPDGHYVVVRGGTSDQAVFYDTHTLNQLFAINLPAGSVSSESAFAFSSDSSKLYFSTDQVVYAYDIASRQALGWLPNIVVEPTTGGFDVGPVASPNYEAMDNSGVLAGPLEEGFGFLDTAQLRTGAVTTTFLNAYPIPATGPAAGGTVVQVNEPATVDNKSQIYFGINPATNVSSTHNFASFTTPAGQPGPANIYIFSDDGGMQLIADGFSYGPSILEVTPDSSTAEGGGTGVIYGYGFAPVNATQTPTDLTVSVGGKIATIQGVNLGAYGVLSPPFQLQSITYTIPPGTSGTSTDVVVTSSSGSTTSAGTFHYLPAVQSFPLPGSSLAQGIYDPGHGVYYFTDANKIQIFSLMQKKWLAPIAVPVPAGATPRLWGLSLSPDGTKLAVADPGSGVVYLLNPASPATVKAFPINPQEAGTGVLVSPAGVAISNSGIVYLVVDVQGGTGYSNFLTLNTNTGVLTDLHLDGPGLGASDLYLRTAISADNTRVYFNDLGYLFSLDTATNRMFNANVGPGCCYGDYDLTLAHNQLQLEGSGYLLDSDLNGEAPFVLNDREVLNISYVYGVKFSTDGSLLFQPATQGIDVFDGRVGTLRPRIELPMLLSSGYDALVSDGQDDVLIAITGTNSDGIAVVDLSSVTEPPPLQYSLEAARSLSQAIHSNVAKTKGDDTTARELDAPAAKRRVVPHITNPPILRKPPP
jgi:IPT/TIG domain-containing protein